MTEEQEVAEEAPNDDTQPKDLKFISDVTLEMAVELGRTEVQIRDLMKWAKGTVLELNKEKGVALDVYANKNSIGRGEAVVVNDKFGVRVTEIACPEGLLDEIS